MTSHSDCDKAEVRIAQLEADLRLAEETSAHNARGWAKERRLRGLADRFGEDVKAWYTRLPPVVKEAYDEWVTARKEGE